VQPSNGDANVLQFAFSPRSVLATTFPEAVGRPLLLFWWSTYLVSPEHLDELSYQLYGKRLPLKAFRTEKRWAWAWWDVEEAVERLLSDTYRVFIFNTGAYWNVGQLHLAIPAEDLGKLHKAVIHRVTELLARVPNHYDIVYRSSHYFTPHCHNATEPLLVEPSPPTEERWANIADMDQSWSVRLY
jgi:hypothetical protein